MAALECCLLLGRTKCLEIVCVSIEPRTKLIVSREKFASSAIIIHVVIGVITINQKLTSILFLVADVNV